MGGLCGNPKNWREEDQIYGARLDTIQESLGEKGMPKFNPPIPRNHKELVIQYLNRSKGTALRPNKDSKVKLNYSGWICEEGDLWRVQTSKTVRLATPFKAPSEYLGSVTPPVKGQSEKLGTISPNISDESGKVYQNSKSTSLSNSKHRLSTKDRETLTVHSPSTSQFKNSNESRSITEKSTLYGKCFEHTESWELQLGKGEVIDGLEEILLSISVGDEVIAFIPSRLAFGNQGLDLMVSPNADLVVQVSLKSIL